MKRRKKPHANQTSVRFSVSTWRRLQWKGLEPPRKRAIKIKTEKSTTEIGKTKIGMAREEKMAHQWPLRQYIPSMARKEKTAAPYNPTEAEGSGIQVNRKKTLATVCRSEG